MIDATLYGLGEVHGECSDRDRGRSLQEPGNRDRDRPFDVMDAAEQFLGPLMSQMQLYDMMSVAMDTASFTLPFLPKVTAAAKKHGVDLRRLVIAMGKLNPVEMDEADLERVARSLPRAIRHAPSEELTSFCVPGISEHSISSSLQSVRSLVDGMSVTCAKRRAKPVLELVPSEHPSPDLVMADLVLAETRPSSDA